MQIPRRTYCQFRCTFHSATNRRARAGQKYEHDSAYRPSNRTDHSRQPGSVCDIRRVSEAIRHITHRLGTRVLLDDGCRSCRTEVADEDSAGPMPRLWRTGVSPRQQADPVCVSHLRPCTQYGHFRRDRARRYLNRDYTLERRHVLLPEAIYGSLQWV